MGYDVAFMVSSYQEEGYRSMEKMCDRMMHYVEFLEAPPTQKRL